MSGTIGDILDNYHNNVDYLLNTLSAYREQIDKKIFKTHSTGECTKSFCMIKDFLTRHNQCLVTTAQRLDKNFSHFERISCDKFNYNRNGFNQRYQRKSDQRNSKLSPVVQKSTQSNPVPCTSKEKDVKQPFQDTYDDDGMWKSKLNADDYESYDENDETMLYNQSVYALKDNQNPIEIETNNLTSEKIDYLIDHNNNYAPSVSKSAIQTNAKIVNNSDFIKPVTQENNNINTKKNENKDCKNDEVILNRQVDILNTTLCTSLSGAEKLSSGLASSKVDQILKYTCYDQRRIYECWITHVDSPFLVWTQLKSLEEQVRDLERNLRKFYNNSRCNERFKIKPDKLREDLYVAAIFSADKKWYRGKIIKLYEQDENKATVFYVDYGNTEEVTIDNLRFLVEKFLNRYPIYATPISIANICPNDSNDWPINVITRIRNFLNNREVRFSTVKNNNWPILFAKFEKVTANKKEYNVVDYITSRKIGQAMPIDYIAEKYVKYMEKHDQLHKFKKYISLNEADVVNLREAQEVGLSHIDEVIDENNEQEKESELDNSIKSDNHKNEQLVELKKLDIEKLEEKIIVHDEKHFITNFEKSIMLKNLKPKCFELNEEAEFKFKMMTIKDPFRFYVTLVNDNHDEYINMLTELNDYYTRNEDYLIWLAKEELKYSFVVVNLVCVAKSNNLFYRAYIKDFVDFDDFYDYFEDENNRDQKIVVCCLENGEIEEVKRSNLFPIAKEFCEKEPYSFCCSLDHIEPFNTNGTNRSNQDCAWTKDEIDIFKEIIQVGKIYSAQSYQSPIPFDKITCYFEDPFQVLIINDRANKVDDLKYINEVLVRKPYNLGRFKKTKKDDDSLSETPSRCPPNKNAFKYSASSLTRTNFIPNDSEDIQDEFKSNRIERFLEDCIIDLAKLEEKKRLKKEMHNQMLKRELNDQIKDDERDKKVAKKPENPMDVWNPTREHFESIRNAYFFNEKSYEAHNFGYETKYQGNICRNFTKSGSCTRKNCPFIHQAPNDELIFSTKTSEKQQIILDLVGYSFEIGDMLYLSGVSFLYPNTINASVLGHYNHNLKTCVSINNFPEITNLMNKYYSKKKFAQEKTTLYSVGQIIAARDRKTDNWFRAKIIQIFPDDNIDNETFEVFYVDLGYSEIQSIKNIYPIKKIFSSYPTQCVQLVIFNTRIEDVDGFSKYISEVSKKTDYLYAIINNIVGESLEVFLYRFFNDDVFCINNEIVEKGFGYPISNITQSSFHYMKII